MKGTKHHRIRPPRNRDTGWNLGARNPRSRNAGATSGHRYYSPELGRWLNRDPIQERGGSNLLAFCGNASVTVIDAHGLTPEHDHAHCENQRLDYEKRLKDPNSAMSIFWAGITAGMKGCQLPRIACVCCKVSGKGGEFDPGAGTDGKIRICENSLSGAKGWTDFGTRLRHELTHASQQCHGYKTVDCISSVCKEIQAYRYDGAHLSKDAIRDGVRFSSFCPCIRDIIPTWNPAETPCEEIRAGAQSKEIQDRIDGVFDAVYTLCVGGVGKPPGLPKTVPMP